jgi:lipoprotein signal peptidase
MLWHEPFLAGTSVLLADQLSKRHILAQPRFCHARENRAFFSIYCIINRRAAVMPLHATWTLVGAWMLSAALALFSLSQEPLARSLLGVMGVGIAVGGVTGNFIDVLRRGGIVDFIMIGRWPIFNLADASIVSGLALAIFALA